MNQETDPHRPERTHTANLPTVDADKQTIGERLLHAALCHETELGAWTATVDTARNGTWNLPWELHTINPSVNGPTMRTLIDDGTGDPVGHLVGHYAPPGTFGLVCVQEVWAVNIDGTRTDASNVTIVMADGRKRSRLRIRGEQLGAMQPEPFDVDRRLRNVLGIMLGVTPPAPDAHEGLLHLLLALAHNISDRYRNTDERLTALRRADPLHLTPDPAPETGRRPEPPLPHPSVWEPPGDNADMSQRPVHDWFDEPTLARVDETAAQHILADCAQRMLNLTDTERAWWGRNGMAAELLEALEDPLTMIDDLTATDPMFATTVLQTISDRRRIWNTPT